MRLLLLHCWQHGAACVMRGGAWTASSCLCTARLPEPPPPGRPPPTPPIPRPLEFLAAPSTSFLKPPSDPSVSCLQPSDLFHHPPSARSPAQPLIHPRQVWRLITLTIFSFLETFSPGTCCCLFLSFLSSKLRGLKNLWLLGFRCSRAWAFSSCQEQALGSTACAALGFFRRPLHWQVDSQLLDLTRKPQPLRSLTALSLPGEALVFLSWSQRLCLCRSAQEPRLGKLLVHRPPLHWVLSSEGRDGAPVSTLPGSLEVPGECDCTRPPGYHPRGKHLLPLSVP